MNALIDWTIITAGVVLAGAALTALLYALAVWWFA